MKYIDGFILAVPTANKMEYIRYAEQSSALFKEYGALSIVECWGDDVQPGKLTSFPQAVMCKEDETVVFSWMTWPTKAIRDAAWKKIMQDPRFSTDCLPMPFDGKRLIYGGFQQIVDV